jgi:hypothetical protein
MKRLSLWLPIRSIAFLLVFVACAGILGKDLSEIGCWWSVIAVILNFLTIGLLVFFAKRNGQSFWQLPHRSWQLLLSRGYIKLCVGNNY